MRIKINYLFVFTLFVFFSFTSCQDEVTEIENPNEQETLVPNSSLVNLMSNVVANNGAIDDFLDNASCFSLELPITIIVSDVTIIIETEADLGELQDLLEDVSVNDDILDFVFPVTIIFSDYNQIVIENEDQLQNFIIECVEDDNDIIECADFVYPISFSAFNSDFNLVETIVIESDGALYLFLDELEDDENALIVSLNFPVTLEYNNGDTVEVTTNEELANSIQAAEQFCEADTDNCVEDDVLVGLLECPWDFTDGTDFFDNYQLIFNSNGSLEISEGMAASAIGGYWDLSSSDNGIILTISELTAFEDSLEGEWLVVSCNVDDYSVNELTLSQGNLELNLEQDCNDDLDCSAIAINSNITECAWSLDTNLITDYPVDVYIHFGSEGTVMIEGADNLESQIGTWEITAIASGVFLEYTLQSPFDVLNGQWQVVECLDGYLYLQNGNNNIELNEACEINNQALLECYSIYVLSQECDNDNDGLATFVIETNSQQTTECNALYPLAGSYHPTYQDAVNTTNHLNITLTTPTELESQFIFFRVFNQDTHEYAVQELELIVESCNDSVFNCFSDFEIIECNQPNNVPVYNLNVGTIGLIDCTEVYYPSFHETLMDAQNDTNAIVNTEAYGALVAEVYLRIESESGNFEIFTIYLNTVDCNYFECFENVVVDICDDDDINDGFAIVTLEDIYSNCIQDDIIVTYHISFSDAEANVDALASPYVNTSNPQTLYVRTELISDSNIYEIFTIELNVINCNSGNCTEGDVDGILTECEWNIASYNGSDNLNDYNFNFEENSGVVVIYTDTIIIDAGWSTSTTEDGVVIEFSNVAGPNIQAINGNWLVVECTANQLILHNDTDSNNEIVLVRTCE
ncbi:hypothetical protein [Winogradskyella ludwigii]|uniref:hypothetical protein n=1 Tax=Winogradskyella ludwigii TaxID=2686076 RepID=UPI0015C8B255|nr:hypothetical protein [Winogradskyella ludwigii]